MKNVSISTIQGKDKFRDGEMENNFPDTMEIKTKHRSERRVSVESKPAQIAKGSGADQLPPGTSAFYWER